MRKTTLALLVSTVILTVAAALFISKLAAVGVALFGIALIFGLAIFRWRRDKFPLSAREEAKAHRRVRTMRYLGA